MSFCCCASLFMMILIHILRLSVAAARPVLSVLGPLVIFFSVSVFILLSL